MTDIDSLRLELEAERHNRARDVKFLLGQREEARAEVERLKRERDALQIRAQEAEGAVWKARLRGDGVRAMRNDACAQCEADWNACCDALVWSRKFGKDLPPPSRAVAAVLEELAKARSMPPTGEDEGCPACHASRQGRLDVAAVTPHVGCYYA